MPVRTRSMRRNGNSPPNLTKHKSTFQKAKTTIENYDPDDLYCMNRLRPTYRGLMHRIAFLLAPFYAYSILDSCKTDTARIGVGFFLFAVIGLFCVSSSFHRNQWKVRQELFMGKLDYTFIFCVVAFSYAPLYMLLVPKGMGFKILCGLALTVRFIITHDQSSHKTTLTYSNTTMNRYSQVHIFPLRTISSSDDTP